MKWIQRLLGLDVQFEAIMADHADIINRLTRIEGGLFSARKETKEVGKDVLRLVLKADPNARSEFDADRIAASDRIGEEAIQRLRAEDWARKHSTGETSDAPPK